MSTHPTDRPASDGPQTNTWLASILVRSNPAWLARYLTFKKKLRHMARGQRRWLLKKAAVSVTGAALLLALAQAPPAHAATITVDNGVVAIADDGQCSLPEAILNANSDSQLYATAGECAPGSGPDTITLPAAGTFTLTAVDNTAYYSDNGLPLIDSQITIDGNGATIERDDLASPFRLMAVTPNGSLTLNNATLSGGVSQEDGGALYIAPGGYALIQDSTLTGNYAFDDGGALENEGTIIIDNSLVRYNYAGEHGGGLANEDGGTLTLRNGTVVDENGAYYSGGGLFQEANGGLVTITGSTISGNSALDVGGGVASYGGDVTISNSTISGNGRSSTVYLGGGVFMNDGTLTIENGAIIDDNKAYSTGGGIAALYSEVTISSSQVTGNEAEVGGGLALNAAETTLSDSSISGNLAAFAGGLLNYNSETTIERSTISDNTAYGYVAGGLANFAFNGFGQTPVSASMTIIDSTISGNQVLDNDGIGGGIYNGALPPDYATASLYVYNSTLDDNSADYGGGLFNLYGTFAIVNSTISGNRAMGGGGVFNVGYQDSNHNVALSTVTGNTASGYAGGILHVDDGDLIVEASIVSGNDGSGDGNELYDDVGGGLIVIDSVLGDNSQTSGDAFVSVIPDASNFVATSDDQNVPLTAILDTTLQNNGGPTETHALVADSPAIDGFDSALCSTAPINGLDQRGATRNVDGDSNPSADECDIGAYEYLGVLPSANLCPVDPPAFGTVGLERTDILGTGMGSPTRSRMVARLTIPNSGDVVDLYGQMAGKELNGVRFVRFYYPQKADGFEQVFQTDFADRGAVSWWGADLDETLLSRPFIKGRWFLKKGMKKMRVPRAIVAYPTYQTTEEVANAWSTFSYPDNFVAGTPGFDQTNTNVLGIPETQGTTDLTVQLAVSDVNRDPRTVDVIVRAGGVEETITLTSPTNKKSELLELIEVTLEDVPAGTDEVEIELVSVLDEGDSAALLGAAAHYVCEPDAAARAANPASPSGSIWNAFTRPDNASPPAAPTGDPTNRWSDSARERSAFAWPQFERPRGGETTIVSDDDH